MQVDPLHCSIHYGLLMRLQMYHANDSEPRISFLLEIRIVLVVQVISHLGGHDLCDDLG